MSDEMNDVPRTDGSSDAEATAGASGLGGEITAGVPERDDELGLAIAALSVPGRPEGFVTDLMAHVAAEEAGAAGAPLDDDRADADSPGHAGQRRRFETRRLRRLALAAAAAAAVLTLGTWLGVSRDPDKTLRFDPDPATAREVIESTLAATGTAESIQATMIGGIVRNGGEFRELERFTFAVDEDGDLARRLVSQASPSPSPSSTAWIEADDDRGWAPIMIPSVPMTAYDTVYDAGERTLESVTVYTQPQTFTAYMEDNGVESERSWTSTTFATSQPDLAAGDPYREEVARLVPWQRLRAYLRQLLAGEAPDMREVIVDGRPAWELTTVEAKAGGADFGEAPAQPVIITIDRETRMPLRYRWRAEPGLWQELRFTDYRLDGDVDDDVFDLEIPDDAARIDLDQRPDWLLGRRFHDVDFSDAALMREKIGPTPGLPAWRPQGFALSSATWTAFDADGNEQALADGTTVATLSLAYRRGIDALYVSAEPNSNHTEMMGSKPEGGTWHRWRVSLDDPFRKAWGRSLTYLRRHTTRVRLHGGAFDGCVAHVVLDPSVLSHLYVRNGAYTATVSGDLTEEEMVAVAESLGAPWMEE
jgi:hypothetical protein